MSMPDEMELPVRITILVLTENEYVDLSNAFSDLKHKGIVESIKDANGKEWKR